MHMVYYGIVVYFVALLAACFITALNPNPKFFSFKLDVHIYQVSYAK